MLFINILVALQLLPYHCTSAHPPSHPKDLVKRGDLDVSPINYQYVKRPENTKEMIGIGKLFSYESLVLYWKQIGSAFLHLNANH
jgi:hypothetical protein